jgi:hypothetical protein
MSKVFAVAIGIVLAPLLIWLTIPTAMALAAMVVMAAPVLAAISLYRVVRAAMLPAGHRISEGAELAAHMSRPATSRA